MTQEQIAAEIAQLEALLSAGASQVSSDGETVTFDQTAIRNRLAELHSLQSGQRHQLRRVRTLDISGAF